MNFHKYCVFARVLCSIYLLFNSDMYVIFYIVRCDYNCILNIAIVIGLFVIRCQCYTKFDYTTYNNVVSNIFRIVIFHFEIIISMNTRNWVFLRTISYQSYHSFSKTQFMSDYSDAKRKIIEIYTNRFSFIALQFSRPAMDPHTHTHTHAYLADRHRRLAIVKYIRELL